MRTIVVQVEGCEVAVLVGYQPASGEATEALVARAAGQPKPQRLEALRTAMTAQALAPLTVALDGKPLAPTSVRAKLALEAAGARPMVVALVTYAIPTGGSLTVTTRDPRTTRVSWTDRASGRVDPEDAPAQGRWYAGVASFLLSLRGPTGALACAPSHTPD